MLGGVLADFRVASSWLQRRLAMEQTIWLISQNRASQIEAVECGVLQACVGLVPSLVEDEDRDIILTYSCMRHITFRCEAAKSVLVNSTEFVEGSRAILDKAGQTAGVIDAVLDLVCILLTTFEHHPIVMSAFLASILSLFRATPQSLAVKKMCIVCLNNLAYNPDSRPRLLQLGVVSLLEPVVISQNSSLFYFDAAIALANLHPFHELLANEDLLRLMMTALHRTLNNQDFPPNSGWYYMDHKLVMSVGNMCGNRVDGHLRSEFASLLKTALDKHAASPILVHNSLVVLWRIQLEPDQDWPNSSLLN